MALTKRASETMPLLRVRMTLALSLPELGVLHSGSELLTKTASHASSPWSLCTRMLYVPVESVTPSTSYVTREVSLSLHTILTREPGKYKHHTMMIIRTMFKI